MSAPTITRINPTSGPTTGGTTVLITGTNLGTPTSVTFGGTAATVNSSTATSISVAAPAHAAGAARVVVTTAAGTSTQPVNFTYITVAAPVITSLSPTSGPVSGGNTITINGTNLLYTTGVTFGATPASSFAILSNTQVAAVAPAGTAGPTTVSVTNGAGTSGTLPYTYNGVAAPVVTSVSPTSGPAAGGTTVAISGSGFTFATAVDFGATPATSFTVASDTVINAVVPPGPNAGGAVNVLVTGPTGSGKTYTSCALAQKACREGFTVVYERASKLFHDLSLAKATGKYLSVLAGLSKKSLLVIDDFALAPLTDEQRRDLLEIVEDRYNRRSTIVVSQVPHDHWHEIIGDPTIADAILDRLVHNAHKLQLKSKVSKRKEESGNIEF